MMKLKPLLIGLIGAGVLAGGGYALYATGMQRGMDMAANPVSSAAGAPMPATAAPVTEPQTA